MSMELFPIPDRSFAGGPQFREWLSTDYDPDEVENDLTITAGITRKTAEQVVSSLERAGFRIDDRFGEVLKISRSTEEGSVESYLTVDEPGVLLFYSNQRKTEDLPLIQDFLRTDRDTYPLFVRPHVIRESLDELMMESEDLKVTEFTARRRPRSNVPAERRPYEERTVSYWAEDGLQVLEEMQHLYGVLPDRVVLELPPETKIGLDRRGWFTFFRGEFDTLLGPLQKAVDQAHLALEAFETSSFQVLPVETETQAFEIPSSRPVKIDLGTSLEYTDADDIRQKLEEQDYMTLNFSAEEGSLFLNSDILTDEGVRFRIKASTDRIRVFPVDERKFSAFMAFYEFVVDEVDAEAELIT